MSQSCPTVQIQTEKTADNPSGIVVINKSDFDESTMQLVGEQAKQEPYVPPTTTAEPIAAVIDKDTKVVAPWASK